MQKMTNIKIPLYITTYKIVWMFNTTSHIWQRNSPLSRTTRDWRRVITIHCI